MKHRTTPFDITPVPKYPRTLVIYRIPGSSFWQCRLHVHGRYKRLSTKTAAKAEAFEFARKLYDEARIADRLDIALHKTSFAAVADRFMRWQSIQVSLGKLSERWNKEDQNKLKADIIPFFAKYDIDALKRIHFEEYLEYLSERKLSRSTLSKHINLLKKIMSYAFDDGVIKGIPKLPKISQEANARAYFDIDSYKILYNGALNYCRKSVDIPYILKGKSVRRLKYTMEFYDLIIFCTNVFIRISDVKELKHKHIKIHENGDTYLEIFPPHSKTSDRSSLSMKRAVTVYKRMLRRKSDFHQDDYVFYPNLLNRKYAMELVRRLFERLLDDLGIRSDHRGKHRTLYSLRHTALMFRFLYGDRIDIHALAKNALTSVPMLEKFYLSHASSHTKIRELQSFRPRSA